MVLLSDVGYLVNFQSCNCMFPFFRLWIPSFTPKYGYCYTYNAWANRDIDPDVPRKASLTGKDYGTSVSNQSWLNQK
jgi:hypothetical protein